MVAIYALECSVNGRAYVGCTASKPNKRAREHRCLLRQRKHTSRLLQIEWDTHGEESFQMKVLEVFEGTSLQEKREAEQRWLDRYAEQGLLCNAYSTSFAPPAKMFELVQSKAHDVPGNRWTPEANLKRSLAQRGIPKGHGAKISATKRANRAMR